jgi:hypothetical protein
MPLREVCNGLLKDPSLTSLAVVVDYFTLEANGAGSLGEISALEPKLRQRKLPQFLQITI